MTVFHLNLSVHIRIFINKACKVHKSTHPSNINLTLLLTVTENSASHIFLHPTVMIWLYFPVPLEAHLKSFPDVLTGSYDLDGAYVDSPCCHLCW